MSRAEDPALADELASIRALGEGRRGDAVEPDAEDPAGTVEDEAAETRLAPPE
ncbi:MULTISPECIES: hypothetical protein [unclassified Rathayibacter]|uniref:hypothetical protein n=1 Tax=unclassified Rathayibacter TaxID=2609250 RepID=UPI001889CA90|nr:MULTISPECIES: hypothetical protein [unclassified Rathayibacter]MBF4461509.1 hypothetical protein [Rathayibacter sp. VKM Ac-2879]MBF4502920.1 hypothetical protein [Rathayibacter sp. VKM Ac-2878]